MADIKEHMEVISADGLHVGTVDKVGASTGRRFYLAFRLHQGWSENGLLGRFSQTTLR
jgi:hypothetical protein